MALNKAWYYGSSSHGLSSHDSSAILGMYPYGGVTGMVMGYTGPETLSYRLL